MCLCRSCSRLVIVDEPYRRLRWKNRDDNYCPLNRKCRDKCPDYAPLGYERPPCEKCGLEKITLYGDGDFELSCPVLVFEYCTELVVCNFSECGLYMASGRMEDGKEPRKLKLEDVFAENPFAKVEAPGCDGAHQLLRESGAKSLPLLS